MPRDTTEARRRRDEDPPSNWEAALEAPPADWQRFARPGRLEDRIAELDALFAHESHERTQRIVRLGLELPRALGRLLGPDSSVIWTVLLHAVAASSHESSQKLSGVEEPALARAGRRGIAAFGSVGAALGFLVYNDHPIGLGAGAWVQDGDEVRLAVAEDRPEHVKAKARMLRLGRELPPGRDGSESRGWLPTEFMPAKQSQSGSTGGSKGLHRAELAADIRRAIAMSRIGVVDLGLLVAADVGVFVGPAKRTNRGYIEPAFERLSSHTLAERLNAEAVEMDPVTAHQVSRRLRHTRIELAKEMAWRSLVPRRSVPSRTPPLESLLSLSGDAGNEQHAPGIDPWADAAGWL